MTFLLVGIVAVWQGNVSWHNGALSHHIVALWLLSLGPYLIVEMEHFDGVKALAWFSNELF